MPKKRPTKRQRAETPPNNPLVTAIELQQQGKLAEAEVQFRQILRVAPTNPVALYSLALILHNAGRPAEALAQASVGTEANPDFAPLWLVLGSIFQSLHRREEALTSYERALVANPHYLEVLVNSGVLLRDLHRHHEALERFRRALEIDPDYETALGNYGILLTEFKQSPLAVATFERLLRKNPDYPYGLGLLCYERLHLCDWSEVERSTQQITAGIRAGQQVCKTLGYMSLSDSARDHFLCAQIFAHGQYPATPLPLWQGENYGHTRLRIAYVSPDLREHPVGHLMAGVIEAHDQARFETIAISIGITDDSRIRARMVKAFDHFIDAQEMHPRQIAELMRQMEVDIAVDLAGYTSDSRTEIFLHRPAPIQINYLGYPGTMGVTSGYDYIIADRTVIPEEHQEYYTEKVAYLDHCYLPIASGIEVAEPQPRIGYGLPEQGFVFCAFSHDYKIHPTVFGVWMRLLAANPQSVLWLMSRNEVSQANLRLAAKQHGLDPARLVFATRVPKVEDHLARYRVADLFLDTWPYNAHTTAADALLAGLPVVTYKGEAFPARVAASLLETLGFGELVTNSLEEYFSLANNLAHDEEKLHALRDGLRPEALGDHPFLGHSFTRSLEKLYTELAASVGGTVSSPAPRTRDDRRPATSSPPPVSPPPTAPALGLAQELFRQGNLPQAELYARQALATGNDRAAAGRLLTNLRQGYGISPAFELSERASLPPDRCQRYLLIKAWGYGFWSEVHHLASQLLLAELTQRTPIVLWGRNCLFRHDHDRNAFNHFFQELSPARLEDIPRSATIYPAKWSWHNLDQEDVNKWEGVGSRLAAPYLFDRPEPLVVSDFYSTMSSIIPWIGRSSKYYGQSEDALYANIFQHYLRPVPAIAAKAEEFFARLMQGRPWVGVHVRGADKIHEAPHLAQTNAAYFGFVERIVELNPTIGIFLLTDSLPLIAEYQQRYGERVLSTPAVRTASTVGVHLSGEDGVAMGEEVLLDVLLACKCDYFVGNQESNVSLAVASMRTWSPGFIFLLGQKSIRSENLFIHQRQTVRPPSCRLCQAPTAAAFSRTVLGKHPVTYFKCSGCGSLQTETPYWLAEAYAPKAERFDTGKASRTLANFLVLPRLLAILNLQPADRCADFGGGTGLFARLMRDIGYNYYSYDKYGQSEFCTGYSWDHFDRPLKLVTLFECAEHFANPAADWASLFATNPDFVVGTTGLYADQGADWPYLTPESGQHLFFHSEAAIAHLAASHGRQAYLIGGYFLLTRFPLSPQTLTALQEWSQDLGSASQETMRSWSGNPFANASRDNEQMMARAQLRSNGSRIAIDGVFFRFATGISRLWKSLLAEWSANGFGEFLTVVDRAGTAPRFAGIDYVDAPPHDYTDLPADRQRLQEICTREKITLFISTYYSTPLTTPAALLVPDMIPEVMGFDLGSAQWQEKHQAIRYCRHFLTISTSTANDLCRFFPEIAPDQVVTAYCGTDFRTPTATRIRDFKQKYGIARPYFLISGVKSGYKNGLLFFQAFARFGEERGRYAIVCTNSPPALEEEFLALVGEAAIHTLVLSDEELQCAYAGALALAYPSRYEGFGLPVLEAMACSCPVITCRNSAIVEVAGEAAIYVDPDDPGEMAAALRAVQEEETRVALIANGGQRAQNFTWRRMADEVERALSRCSQKRGKP